MELIYTDEACVDRGVLRSASGDFSVGVENTWSLDVPLPTPVSEGCLVYVDGTEFCGVVDDYETVTGSGVATISGRTVQGVLATNVICPPEGSDRLSVSGDANECIAAVLENVGLGLPFQVAAGESGVRVDCELDRFVDAYAGIASMLDASGAKLIVEVSGARVTLGAAPRRVEVGYDGETSRVRVRRSRAVNHLVCLGSGELQEREVIHLYADEHGNVGTTQRIFGMAHMAAVYDYNNADAAELRSEGEKKLSEMQSADAASIDDAVAGAWDVGDVVGARFGDDGAVVSETVKEKIARVSGRSVVVEYKTGSKNEGGTITGSAESSGSGGVSYVAGDGISIAGGTISADVTQADLDVVASTADDARKTASDAQAAAGRAQQTADGKADAGHKHSASDVTSGVLPVARGGTGATDRVGVWNNVMMMELLDWETVDWNTLTDSGFARNTSLSGKNAPPCGYTYGMLEVARSNINPSAQYLIQRWTSDGMHGSYVRNGWKESDGSYSWSSWNKLAYEQDVAPKSHKHSKADVTDFPASMPASDVSAWAKAPTKPTYTAAEVGAAAKAHTHAWGDVTGKPTTYPPEAHTHPYAGSASAGGAAASAVKLATPRKIAITGTVSGSATFDGTTDVTVTVTGDQASAGFLAAHPVGCYFETSDPADPGATYGGTWTRVPSTGPHKWHREA